ncbi:MULTISPECIES: type VI secretion system-associated FHA domain protein TagH [Aliivibrio]|uniref:Type VI secretion system-associated FHA domain protein TagH n=1 Tax=Aliivibrio finisterrensis TaxID=511998 RepID=A0A4Q5KVV3_9GAMM|nr:MULTISPECIES: type VI secretion system-associated FHA domain protein TagH [Aliivibrio]MDD9179297.1 type VI secretion system-associated FHA domain protein TagH [Aliivibrio sp. A6]RYU51133.1 type VI secretion system-associated FHA domain protein TagH [Aliivibrio finisterrensis]RYU55515.1 type VI secretion system-associated FHA domain protein TagH [Aliivibrio finisterrensis]RYU60387.1 type VI secretion system-associated FHA domain protein TagH [Aliivibrio finisterrensis]RYU64142.1 type VI secr
MELAFDIIKSHDLPIDTLPTFTFKKAGGTIGRSPNADWYIADTKRQLSNIHASISFDDQQYFITDSSTNGTYFDGQEASLNTGELHPVSHGDVYELGFIKIRARILQDPTNYASPEPTNNAALDPLANHGTDQNPSVFDMIPDDSFLSNTPIEELLNSDEEIILKQVEENVPSQSIMDDALLKEQFISPVLDDDIISEDIELETQAFKTQPTSKAHASTKRQTTQRTQPQAEAIGEDNDAYLAALSKGLGIELNDLEDPEQTLFEIGAALRSSVNGIQQLLRTRTELKNKLTANATTIQAQGNNPIKFSHDVNDALNVIIHHKPGYLQGIEAISQSCKDIQANQLAIHDACQHTLDALIDKLSPQTLIYRFVQEGVQSKFGKADAQYWQAYSKLHEQISKDPDWRNALLEQDFAKQYETQLQMLSAALRV